MKKYLLILFSFASFVFAQNFGSPFNQFSVSESAEETGPYTTARLISEHQAFVPGETLMLGLVLEMKDHWHTYWENPGDAGMPTTVSWDLPEGFEAGEIIWPTPERLVVEGLVSFGYENKVILHIPLKTPADYPIGDTVLIKGDVTWLECKEACLPGSAEVSLSIGSAETAGAVNEEMASMENHFPSTLALEGVYERKGNAVLLSFPASEESFVQFVPFAEGMWQLEPAPVITSTEDEVVVRLVPSALAEEDVVPEGVLINEAGHGFVLDAIRHEGAGEMGDALVSDAVKTQGLLPVLILAFLGGILLNLLPCVFPVLGLKISGFVEQAHGDPRQAKVHALVFSAGILCSLWILAAVVSSLNLAWGGQLGDPVTVTVLILLLSLFTLNLFGVFELGHMFTRMGGVGQKKGYSGSFFSGVLVTVIATPCTGPFMAGAISWALTQPAIYAFLAFTSLGLGIAAPYVLLSFSPKLMEKMPRPGAWMETFKQGSAFFMVAFVWVLLWVLSSLVPVQALVRVLAAICFIMLASWILGKWGAIHRSQKSQRIGKGLSVLLIVFAFWFSLSYQAPLAEIDAELQQRIESGTPIMYQELSPELVMELQTQGIPVHWTPFTPERLDALLADDQAVFIDFTAKWCLTCQANKRSTLYKEEVLKAFQDAGVVTLTADMTKDDPVMKKALAFYGRRGVPTYILYNQAGEWSLLPETLTPGMVTGAL
ncbi:protein-disulfide reductase DsbD family protein [Kiritimatiellota bacterium B12222]|nr:protein-disulfide reductase DsbD family protein [Kiritimatiellota bacterium B12222]